MSQITNESNPEISDFLDKKNSKQATKLARLLEEYITARREAEDRENQLKAELKEMLTPAYFGVNEDAEQADDVVHTFDLGGLQVNFINAYQIKDDKHLVELLTLLGEGHPLADWIAQDASLAVDLSGLSKEHIIELTQAITDLALDYDITPRVVTSAVATQEFHDMRHVLLTAEDNLALDEVLPVKVQIAKIQG